MQVLSLFNGHSCGMIALEVLGLKVNKYYVSEIDKHANKVAEHLYPETIFLGDVTKWREWDIDWSKIDLLLGGSPCQGFSLAGKKLAFDDPRSKLFFVFVEIWEHIKKHNLKAHYLLENVRMKSEHEKVISNFIGIEPIVINSALLSAQNRVRLYWTNIYNKPYGLFGDMECKIPQPQDKGILLKYILDDEVDEKYYLSDKMLQYFYNRAKNFNSGKVNVRNEEGKSSTLTASMASCDISDNFIKIDTNLKKSKNQGKANTFTAGGNSGGLHSDMTLIVASRGRNPENPKSRKPGEKTEQHLEPRNDGKTNCLTTVQKDNLVITHSTQPRSGKGKGGKGHLCKNDQKSYFLDTGNSQAIEFTETKNYLQWDVSGKGYKSQQDRAFYENGKHGCLSSSRPETKNGVVGFGTIRRLTPRECGRLQTVPENILDKMLNCGVSDTQLYKMFGNGWTVEVIAYILSFLNKK